MFNEASTNSGSEQITYSYKGMHCIVLLAVVDLDYGFTDFEVSHKGSESDVGVFQNSPLWMCLKEGGMLSNGFIFDTDDAFPLKPITAKRQRAHQEQFGYYIWISPSIDFTTL